jgi:hypothetical protein
MKDLTKTFDAEEKARQLGRSDDLENIGALAQYNSHHARIGLLRGCIEAWENGRMENMAAFDLGTSVYLAEGGTLNRKTAKEICSLLDNFIKKNGRIQGIVFLSKAVAHISGINNDIPKINYQP